MKVGYHAPGVYAEYVDTGSRPIEGVSTSITGMIGITDWGPVDGPPVQITNFADFQRIYGGFLDTGIWGDMGYLPMAAKGFFENGGQNLYIKRVLHDQAGNTAQKDFQASSFETEMLKFEDHRPLDKGGILDIELTSMLGVDLGSELFLEEKDQNGIVHSLSGRVISYNKKKAKLSTADNIDPWEFKVDNTRVTVKRQNPAPNPDQIFIRAKYPGTMGGKIRYTIKHSFTASSTLAGNPIQLEPLLTFETNPTLESVQGKTYKITLKDGITVSDDDFKQIRPNDGLVLVGDSNNIEATVLTTDPILRKITVDITGSAPDTVTHIQLPAFRYVKLALKQEVADLANIEVDGELDSLALQDNIYVWYYPTRECLTYTLNSRSGSNIELTPVNGANLPNQNQPFTPHNCLLFHATSSVTMISSSNCKKNDPVVIEAGNSRFNAIITNVNAGKTILDINLALLDTDSNYRGAAQIQFNIANADDQPYIGIQSVAGFNVGDIVELDNGTNKEINIIETVYEKNKQIRLKFPFLYHYCGGNDIRNCKYEVSFALGLTNENLKALTLNKDLTKTYLAEQINRQSQLVVVDDKEFKQNRPFILGQRSDNLIGGNIGKKEDYTVFDYLGQDDETKKGLKAFEDIEDISIIAIPGITDKTSDGDKFSGFQASVIEHCENMKYRFAILDVPSPNGTNSINPISDAQKYKAGLSKVSSYAAIYYPWLKVRDPFSNTIIDMPPSGHLAGIFARTDEDRGVHKAPANEEVRGIISLTNTMNKIENGNLNDDRINAIRSFSGKGHLVWGARTMAAEDNPDWKYISVSRLMMYIARSIEENTTWVVFMPNNEQLWARVRMTVNEFLTRVWRDGALMGTKADQAFYVKCDRTTMSQSEIDAGQLIVEIGIAPVKPAEFVIFRISQWYDGVK